MYGSSTKPSSITSLVFRKFDAERISQNEYDRSFFRVLIPRSIRHEILVYTNAAVDEPRHIVVILFCVYTLDGTWAIIYERHDARSRNGGKGRGKNLHL